MTHAIFSDAWATACMRAINGHAPYREAARGWEGAVLLRLTGQDQGDHRVFLDLWHGECRAARAASEADEAEARFILSGALEAWRLVLSGKLGPLPALLGGRLRLVKGSVAELVPWVNAARELVVAAATVEVIFPGGT